MMRRPELEPSLLKAFVAVAETLSFTRAARALNRTQSAVSMQIKRLEDQLGVALFQRTKSHVALTAAGEGLVGYAKRILRLGDEAVGRLGDYRVEGRVRLGVMEDYGAVVLPPLLSRFAAAHPDVVIEMEIGLTQSMPDRLGDAFDVVVAMHPVGQEGGQFLRREKALWVAGHTNALDDRDVLPIALYPPGCLFRKWAIEALEAAGRRWRLAFVSQSQASVEAIVSEGLAVSVVKAGTFSGRLRALSKTDGMPALPEADIRLHRASDPTPAAAVFANYLQEHLSDARERGRFV